MMIRHAFYKVIRNLLQTFQYFTQFARFSSCSFNMSKSEAIHVGSLNGCDFKPLQNDGLILKKKKEKKKKKRKKKKKKKNS